jgi:hypothetical protein
LGTQHINIQHDTIFHFSDLTQRCITILPDRFTDESKALLRNVYGISLQEVNAKEANELLIKLSPKTRENTKVKVLTQQQKQQSEK